MYAQAYPNPSTRRSRVARRACSMLLGMVLVPLAVTAAAGDADTGRSAVMTVVEQLFDGMRQKDEQLLHGVFAPGARVGNDKAEVFIGNVLASTVYLDEVTFDETVRMDGDLAMAWTPYNIFVDGTFHHCGVDLFVMRRIDGAWKISTLDDTRRTDGCDPERRE